MILENSLKEISDALDASNEWLLIDAAGTSFALKRDEIELEAKRGKILLSFLNDKGFQIWRVVKFQSAAKKLTLDLTRNFDRERTRVNFVPRIASAELSGSIELARLEKTKQIAALIVAENPRFKIVRAALNEENGRFAEIFFENATHKRQFFALADVTESVASETLLTFAVLRLAKIENRRRPIKEIWILAEKKSFKNLRRLHALLAKKWKEGIIVKEISRSMAKNSETKITDYQPLSVSQLWREKPAKIALSENAQMSLSAAGIINLAPEAIDSIFTKHGETLRFRGLPFARVRIVGGAEKCWFGINRDRRILTENTRDEFFDLLENLKNYRRFDAENKRHELFRLAPEAWLEAMLRRDINRLDGNLILSPLYNQFRAGADKIDLLALRRDGRLIVIELKIEPDREMIFQAIDYWRKIELQRRGGNLQKAKIFGELEIADKPAIVYLAAPTLAFHRDFEFLSKTVAPEIEIYRFDLNENWRENLKIMRVEKT